MTALLLGFVASGYAWLLRRMDFSVLAMIPLVLWVSFFRRGTDMGPWWRRAHRLIRRYSLAVAWFMVGVGLAVLLVTLEFAWYHVCAIMAGCTLLGWIISFALSYRDGQSLFHVGLYIVLLCFLVLLWYHEDWLLTIHVAMMFATLLFAVYASFVWVGQLFVPIPSSYRGFLFFLFHVMVGIVLYRIWYDSLLVVVLMYQAYITLVYAVDYYLGVWHHRKHLTDDQLDDDTIDDDVMLILQGGRVTDTPVVVPETEPWVDEVLAECHQLFRRLHPWVHHAINIVAVMMVIILFFDFVTRVVGGIAVIGDYGIYWLSVVFFMLSFFLLQYQQRTLMIHKIMFFVVINCAVYLVLFVMYGLVVDVVVMRAIVRNICTSVALVAVARRSRPLPWLTRRDIFYGVVSALMAMLLNMVLLSQLAIDGRLIFATIMMYGGVQALLLWYTRKIR